MIGRFIYGLFGFSVKTDDAFVLFIGELKDIYFAALGKGVFHVFPIGVHPQGSRPPGLSYKPRPQRAGALRDAPKQLQ